MSEMLLCTEEIILKLVKNYSQLNLFNTNIPLTRHKDQMKKHGPDKMDLTDVAVPSIIYPS